MKHEWFHMYQHYIHGVNVWGVHQGMAEFEQAVFYDIVVYSRGNRNLFNHTFQDTNEGYSSWVHRINESIEDYTNWIDRIIMDPNLLKTDAGIQEFKSWAILFGEYSSYKESSKYQYSGMSYTPSSLINLTSLSNKSCK